MTHHLPHSDEYLIAHLDRSKNPSSVYYIVGWREDEGKGAVAFDDWTDKRAYAKRFTPSERDELISTFNRVAETLNGEAVRIIGVKYTSLRAKPLWLKKSSG